MTDIGDFLVGLAKLDVKLSLEEGELRCSAPKGVLTPDLVKRLKEQKPLIIAYLEEINAIIRKKQNPIVPVPRNGHPAASHAQMRLWFIEQMGIQDSTYMIRNALRLKGTLEQEPFARAIDTIVARHEILRTNFRQVEGQLVQYIHAHRHIEVQRVDLCSQAEPVQAAQSLISREMGRPFNLAEDPLLRVMLLHLGEEDFLLHVVMHHIVSDGWSMNVMIHELTTLYNAYLDGAPDPLPPLSIQYADYAHWQTQWLDGKMMEAQKRFWQHQLEDAPDFLLLPSLRPHLPIQSFRGERRYFTLAAGIASGLKALTAPSGSTMFMVLEAAFAAFLYRYSGQTDILVGTPVANRHRQVLEPMIGFFVNTVVLRHRIAGSTPFLDFLAEARKTSVEAFAHQDIPFEQVVEALKPKRCLSYNSLFQVAFVLQDSAHREHWLRGLRSRPETLVSDSAKFDLTLAMSDNGQGFDWSLEYNTDLFDEPFILAMAGHFTNFLEGIAGNPEGPLDRIPLMARAEQTKALAQGLTPSTPSPGDEPSLLGALKAHPARIALTQTDGEGPQVTYTALRQRAEHLTGLLQQAGAGLVGIDTAEPVSALAGLIGALEAGVPFVALPAGINATRHLQLVQALGVDTLIQDQGRPDSALKRVTVGQDSADLAERSTVSAGRPAAAALFLGSSLDGHPKSTLISRSALTAQTHQLTKILGLGANSVLFLGHPLFSEMGQVAALSVLACGGRLVIPREPVAPTAIPEEITHLLMPPSLFLQLVAEGLLDRVDALETVLLSGEHAAYAPCRAWRGAHPRARLLHGLSLPEMTGLVSYREVAVDEACFTTPIGTPVGEHRLLVVDPHLCPVPAGVAGELLLSGPGLAEGYHGHSELSEARFITLGGSANRWFRTGETAKMRPDGEGILLGQDPSLGIDREPSLTDLEACLLQQPGVVIAAARYHEDGEGERRLVAYHQGGNVSLARLEAVLPSYLCPAALVSLARIPRTLKAKIDRSALSAPPFTRNKTTFTAPRTPMEGLLALIWSEVLGRESIDVCDNFFDLGGQSLMATRVASRVRETLRVELPLKSLFLNPTIASLAAFIDSLGGHLEDEARAGIEPCANREDLPLSFAQKRLWFIHELNPASTAYNLPIFFRLSGPLNVLVLQRCLDAMVRRHETLRTTFMQKDGNPIQQIAAPTSVPLQVLALSQDLDQDEHLRALMTRAGMEAFDLKKGPLFRAQLYRLAEGEHILFLNQHHIISDGWSINLMIAELAALYPAFLAGADDPLPPLRVQYPDYAAWQSSYRESEAYQRSKTYWINHLQDAPRYLELPVQFPRPAIQTFEGASLTLEFEASTVDRITTFGRQQGATLFMSLLAGFANLLARYSHQDDLVIGSPCANRGRKEIEPLIGFFVNTLVYRLRMTARATVSELVAQARTECMEAFTHQEFPFEQLVELLQPERNLGRSPLFQVLFALQNATDKELSLPGLTVTPLSSDRPVAKFDLTLNVVARGGAIVLSFIYNRALFQPSFIARMAHRYRTLMEAMIAHPKLTLGQLSVLDEGERVMLLETWNQTAKDFAVTHLLDPIEARTRHAGHRIAARFKGDSLTYAALDARAEVLAEQLIRQGIGPNTPVGIYMQRGLPMLVGMLGILKAGGAYVPLDPSYPVARLSFMIEDADLSAVVCDSATLPPTVAKAQAVMLDRLSDGAQAKTGRPPRWPDQAAYILYTSGSTGKPKGAVLSHRAVCNQMQCLQESIHFTPQCRVLQKTPISFDASVWELFLPLWDEPELVLADPDAHLDPTLLARLLHDWEITHLQVVPSLLEALTAEPAFRENHLTQVFCGGEALTRDLYQRFRGLSQAVVVNLYGPTEAAIQVCIHEVDEAGDQTVIALGRPTYNCRMYLFDRALELTPVDLIGELCIAGPQLAQGYRGRPGLTAQKFVPDPHAQIAGDRLYRTGDLALQLENGSFSFKGRSDEQIKLRGLRIELGEIERSLHQIETVMAAAVIVREDMPGGPAIVAYVATEEREPRLTTQELQNRLQQSLPRYMVPTCFVMMTQLPVMPNGKLDRKALPAPDISISHKTFVPPSNALEEDLAAIWREVLGVERVGVEDNFFEIGGHSLLVAKVVSRVRERLDIELPMKFLFEQPTIAGTAKRIQSICEILPGLMEEHESSDAREEVAI